MKEYIICYILDEFNVGDVFVQWPLHMTIVPWFYVEDTEWFIDKASLITSKIPTITTMVGDQFTWGRHIVNVVEKTDSMQSLHDSLFNLAKSSGKMLTKEDYSWERFRPHVTHQGTQSARPNERLEIKHIYLIEKDIHSRPKTVIAKLTLA